VLPDGFSMRLPVASTDADGAAAEASEPDAVVSVDAIRALLEMVEALLRRRGIDAGGSADLLLREVVARGGCLGGVGEEGLDIRATSGE
jgi:hypothetical protein